ncbi:MAG: YceI family protein [Flavobacteriales bacterium]
MKMKFLSAVALVATLLTSCGETTTTEVGTALNDSTATVYNVDLAASKVNWKGEVAGVYGHNGYVNFKSGTLQVNDSGLVGGELVVDLTNIVPLDSASYTAEKGHGITDLQGHLSKGDFFLTDSFPTSTFVITKVEGKTVKGNLTVKGKTNEETLNIESFENKDGVVTASGKLVFNRQKYGVSWVHFMKDMILSDDIQLNISLTAKK